MGLLVLLLGCLVTHWWGQEATLAIYETRSNSRAYKPSQHFQLTVVPDNDAVPDSDAKDAKKKKDELETIKVPFVGGPFNWEDYQRKHWFPWHLARRDKGVLYDRDGIKLQVLDYYSDSSSVSAPRIVLNFDVRPTATRGHGQFGEDHTLLTLSVDGGNGIC